MSADTTPPGSGTDWERESSERFALRPPLPVAKRLNRNALTVAAVLMGMTVLTAVIVLDPRADKSGERARAPDEGPVSTSEPTFLDEPVRSGLESGTAPVQAAEGSDVSQETVDLSDDALDTAGLQEASGADLSGVPETVEGASHARGSERNDQSSERERRFQAALTSSALVTQSASGPASDAATHTGGAVGAEEQLVALGDSILRAAMARDPNLHPSESSASTRSAPDERRAERRPIVTPDPSVVGRLAAPASPFTLRAGTVIPGVLITAVTSELPGEILAQVSRDVYDSESQRILLIPRGSRLLGTYDNQVAAGQGRLLVAWTRLTLPNGRSTTLPGLPLKDRQGQTGARDRVDNHWRQVFGNALLLSAIGAGVQLSQPAQTSVLAAPSAAQVASGALGQELSTVALEILRRGMDVAPTITIRAGQPFTVFLNGDLVFDGPYASPP